MNKQLVATAAPDMLISKRYLQIMESNHKRKKTMVTIAKGDDSPKPALTLQFCRRAGVKAGKINFVFLRQTPPGGVKTP